MPNADIMKAILALILSLAVAGIVALAYDRGGDARDLAWQVKLGEQKQEANKLLAEEKEKVRAAEAALANLNSKTEIENAQANQTIERVRAENRRLVAASRGVLHDPGRREGGGCSKAADPGTPSVPERGTTGADLSTEASEFLLELTYEADRAAVYAQSCRKLIIEMTEMLKAYATAH